MSTRYIVFLRAINVGGRTIKMDQLRDLFSSFGYTNVETFIASGNVILGADETDPAAVESHIEEQLQAALGYSVPAIIRTPAELTAMVAHRPFTDEQLATRGKAFNVWLLKDDPAPGLEELVREYQTPDDLFHVHGRAVYWLCRTNMSQSVVPTVRLEKAFGTPCTMRTMNTIRRLAAKYPAG